MGLFSRMKDGIKSKANAALDKAIDPAKEIEMAILELEEQRKAALQELISYKATAKQLEEDIKRQEDKAVAWEKRAMAAVKAGDDDAARTALKQKKDCLIEAQKIRRDRDEAASYAIGLNKSRKEFETKLQILKLKKGTLATQLAAARSGGDAFGNDGSVWDRFQSAEDRIEEEAVASEVDAAMRGEEAAATELEARILSAGASAGVATGGAGTDDALAAIKARVAAEREARQRSLAAASARTLAAGKGGGGGDGGDGEGTGGARGGGGGAG
ncbi:MAG: PspA/IM30 family protein [Myxococcales bacterium]|nr:PspA/IM30 family protein [Myxococcales bacterium]